MTNRIFGLAGLWFSAVLVFPGLSAFAAPGEDRDLWFSIHLEGQKAGYYYQSTRLKAAGRSPVIETIVESNVSMTRLGTKIEFHSKALYRETKDGDLKHISSEYRFSGQAVEAEADVGTGEIILTTSSGGKPFTQKIAYSGRLLGPEGIRRLSRTGLRKKDDAVQFRTFSPELNRLFNGTRTAAGMEDVRLGERAVTALKIIETFAEYPVSRSVWLDADGWEIQVIEPSAFGEMAFRRTTEAEALSAGQPARLPEEIFAQTLVRSKIRLPQARLIESMTLRIRSKNPDLGWPDFPGPSQTVLGKKPGELVLKIDRPRVQARPAKKKAPRNLREYLSSSVYLNTEDPLIRKTAREIIGREKNDYRKALRLKNWVSRRMRFDPGIAFAPSSEVIRNLKGTCTEYAMLLTTLSRAAGLPARYLMGYVYVNGIWGGHAWTEVYVGDAWIPLDAAVNGPGAADAARFHFCASSLDSGPGDCLLGGQRLFGGVEIDVLEYALEGKTVRVDPLQPLVKAEGDLYINPGLGIRISKPKNFSFKDMDRVWPDKTLVSLVGPGDETVRLLQDPWMPDRPLEDWTRELLRGTAGGGVLTRVSRKGFDIYKMAGPDRAAAAVPNGVDLWVITAEGKNSSSLLDLALETFTVEKRVKTPPPD